MNVSVPTTDDQCLNRQQSPVDIADSCNQFEQLLNQAASREQLLQQASLLLQKQSASFITKIMLDEAGAEPSFETIASQFDETPEHIQGWALAIALKAAITDRPIVESAVDQMGFQVHMVGVTLSRAVSNVEILAVLFSQGSSDGVLEVMLLNSAGHVIRSWDDRQDNLQFVQLAEDTAALIDLRSKIERADSVNECCGQIANELNQYVTGLAGIDRESVTVFVSTVDPSGRPSLAAMSGVDALPEDAQRVEAIESACGECLCRNRVTLWPPESSERHAMMCHQRLAQLLPTEYIQSVPLHDSQGTVVAVSTLTSHYPINERIQRLVSSSAQPFGSTLELVQRAEQNHLQKFLNRTRESLRTEKTKLILRCLAAVLLVGLVPMPYRVATECEVQPLQRRYVCAPFEAQLGQCRVEPGDVVVRDQLLATLDEREIRMELAQVEADYHRAAKKRDGLVAAHESGEARLASFEADSLRARNELLRHRTDNLQLKSPIDGMIIEGDHRDNEGMPLETGKSLFQIAPLDKLKIELFVPDADVRYVQAGMNATIRLEAFPFESWRGEIVRVQPAAEIHHDDSVFVATVCIENPGERLRPGMTGSARISSVWRPVAWNWLHQPIARCLRWVGW